MHTALSSLLHNNNNDINDNDNNNDNNNDNDNHAITSSIRLFSHVLRALFPLWSSSCWKQQDHCGLVDCFCIPEWTWASLLSIIEVVRQVVIQGSEDIQDMENMVDLMKRLLQFVAVMLRV